MPGPGAHLMYTLAAGAGLMRLSRGRFGAHHCLVYSVNAFLGPDLGSFAEWLGSHAGGTAGSWLGSAAMDIVHHPFLYPLLLGGPLAAAYSALSARLLRSGMLDSASGVGLNKRQCFLLIAAGSLSHFFLDHLFEESGRTKMFTWIISTGWWDGPAPVNMDAVFIIGFLCSCLLVGFVYINRVKHEKSIISKSNQSLILLAVTATFYCMWCTVQIYLREPRQPAIGEEADLGVIVFLATYLFLPHGLCLLSMSHKDQFDASIQLDV